MMRAFPGRVKSCTSHPITSRCSRYGRPRLRCRADATRRPRRRRFCSTLFRRSRLNVRSEVLYLTPNHLQVLAVRAAALALSGRCDEAAKATEVLLNAFPTLTVERHLRNFHWKNPADIAHYREGLLKAGVPLSKSLAEPAPKCSV